MEQGEVAIGSAAVDNLIHRVSCRADYNNFSVTGRPRDANVVLPMALSRVLFVFGVWGI
jgi:hypothetical protein